MLKVQDTNYNLGLQRIEGAADCDKIKNTLRDLLFKFNIDLDKDVISVTSDGAKVMVKVGKEISPLALLCMAHGIHLAVQDCLYKTEISPSNYDNDNDYSDSDSELD